MTADIDIETALDLIRQDIPNDKPDWTENICWTMNDPETGLSLYGHMGRMQPDRTIWEGLALIVLPGGDYLVNRNLGPNLGEARNAEHECIPVLSNKVWQYRFAGMMYRVTAEDLRNGPIVDAPLEQVSYNVIYDAVMPNYNMHNADLNADRMHLEQGARVKGHFVIGGKRMEVDCLGYRDHSVSERTFKTLDAESWSHCVFPSGKIFSLLQVFRQEVRIIKGHIFKDGILEVITADEDALPELHDTAGNPQKGILRLVTDSGSVEINYEVIDGRAIQFNLLPPVGLRPGVDPDLPDNMVAVQCPTKFTWEGEVGYGWLERIRPLKLLK
jgi:hypothetical protein